MSPNAMSAIRINISFSFSFSSICSIGAARIRARSRSIPGRSTGTIPVHGHVDRRFHEITAVVRSACAATHRRWKDSAFCGHEDLWAECQTSMTEKCGSLAPFRDHGSGLKSLHMKPGRLARGGNIAGVVPVGNAKVGELIPGGKCRGIQRVSGFDQFGQHRLSEE